MSPLQTGAKIHRAGTAVVVSEGRMEILKIMDKSANARLLADCRSSHCVSELNDKK
jgi:hypothetical protein